MIKRKMMCFFGVVGIVIVSITLISCGGGSDAGTSATPPGLPAPSDGDTYRISVVLGAPLSGADVAIYSIDNTDIAIASGTTSDQNSSRVGVFSVDRSVVRDDELYLISVSGGSDLDTIDNPDAVPTTNQGRLHALVTSAQIRSGQVQVNILTEVIFRRLSYLIAASYSVKNLIAEINRRAPLALYLDITGDGAIDHNDISTLDYVQYRDALPRAADLKNLTKQLRAGEDVREQTLRFTEPDLSHFDIKGTERGAIVTQFEHFLFMAEYFYSSKDPTNPNDPGKTDLVTYDISNPMAIREVQRVTVENFYPEVMASARATVAIVGFQQITDGSRSRVVHLFNFNDLGALDPTAMLTQLNYGDVKLSNNRLYVAGNGGIDIFDVTDLSSPIRIGGYDTSARSFSVIGNQLFVFEPGLTARVVMKLIDVTDTTQPRVLAQVDIPGAAETFYEVVSHSNLIFVSGYGQINLFSQASDQSLTSVSHFPASRKKIMVSGNLVTTSSPSGLMQTDITDPAIPKNRSAWLGFALPSDPLPMELVAERENFAIVLSGNVNTSGQKLLSVSTVDWTDPYPLQRSNLDPVDTEFNPYSFDTMTTGSDVLYAKTRQNIFSYRIGLNGDLTLLDRIAPQGAAPGLSMFTVDQSVFVGVLGTIGGLTNLLHIDITDPSKLVATAMPEIPDSYSVFNIAWLSRHALLATENSRTVTFLDVASILTPTVIGQIEGPVRGTAFSDDYAFISTDAGVIQAWNIQNPSSPVKVGEVKSSSSPSSESKLVFFPDSTRIVRVDPCGMGVIDTFDVTDASAPLFLGSRTFTSHSRNEPKQCYEVSLHVAGPYLFVASALDGIAVFESSANGKLELTAHMPPGNSNPRALTGSKKFLFRGGSGHVDAIGLPFKMVQ